MSAPKLTEAQRRDLKRNLSPTLYDAQKRLRAAARRFERNNYVEVVEVRALDLWHLLGELDRIYTDAGRAALRGGS